MCVAKTKNYSKTMRLKFKLIEKRNKRRNEGLLSIADVVEYNYLKEEKKTQLNHIIRKNFDEKLKNKKQLSMNLTR